MVFETFIALAIASIYGAWQTCPFRNKVIGTRLPDTNERRRAILAAERKQDERCE